MIDRMTRFRLVGWALASLACAGTANGQPATSTTAAPTAAGSESIGQIAASAGFVAANRKLESDYDRVIAELGRITETPAPPMREAARARLFAELLRGQGLETVSIDKVGNVLALRRGSGPGRRILVVSAHLDTVFPEGTPIKVRREGDRLFAPGIGDDSLGLASLLAWARVLNAANIRTRDDILFVGTVGEEGAGNLRGVRHLFAAHPDRARFAGFISVDNADAGRVVHGAVGSRRYRVTFTGPGGHSYGAFGSVNPLAALADTVRRLYLVDTPEDPKTTYSASVVSGGTSVNSIPDRVHVDIDMRSKDQAALQRLERRFMAIVAEAVAAENHARSTEHGSVAATPELIGDRPAGSTPADHPMVRHALESRRLFGIAPRLDYSSTDSNIPMSLGVPAVTIGAGAGGGRSHSLEEYIDVPREPFLRGLSAGLALLIAAAGMDEQR